MKKEFKIVICGGGSTYTAGIVKNLLEEEELKIKELWLYDIDQERQEKVSLIVKEVASTFSLPKRCSASSASKAVIGSYV